MGGKSWEKLLKLSIQSVVTTEMNDLELSAHVLMNKENLSGLERVWYLPNADSSLINKEVKKKIILDVTEIISIHHKINWWQKDTEQDMTYYGRRTEFWGVVLEVFEYTSFLHTQSHWSLKCNVENCRMHSENIHTVRKKKKISEGK